MDRFKRRVPGAQVSGSKYQVCSFQVSGAQVPASSCQVPGTPVPGANFKITEICKVLKLSKLILNNPLTNIYVGNL